jgi:TonB family protein
MRRIIFSFILLFGCVGLLSSQTIDLTSPKSTLPKYRPAVLGSGPSALINKIDAKGLLAKGQKDAAVMFICSVLKTGELGWSGTYRGTPGSKLLEDELRQRLLEVKFVPAVYNQVIVDAIFYGTVTFVVVDGKPRLRIFSNQEAAELKKESDFIGPQPVFGLDSKFQGFHYPTQEMPVKLRGAVELKLKIDANGSPTEMKLGEEEPPFLGFGDAALFDFRGAKFVPAFRDGKPVACEVTLPVYYVPKT